MSKFREQNKIDPFIIPSSLHGLYFPWWNEGADYTLKCLIGVMSGTGVEGVLRNVRRVRALYLPSVFRQCIAFTEIGVPSGLEPRGEASRMAGNSPGWKRVSLQVAERFPLEDAAGLIRNRCSYPIYCASANEAKK